MVYVDVKPRLLSWVLNRGKKEKILKSFPKFQDWIENRSSPTLKQLENLSRVTYIPIGYFFLDDPPDVKMPIPDFRTIGNRNLKDPSPDLLDTIYICQQRQEWFKDHAIMNGLKPFEFIDSLSTTDDIVTSAEKIRGRLRFNISERKSAPTWTEALRLLVSKAENFGILVMINSVVGNNTHRRLNIEEFRGFALVDNYAPLIFINSSDSKSAQMFTLAHEIAHLWIGETGISNSGLETSSQDKVEEWCNRCAAEILVPLKDMDVSYRSSAPTENEVQRLAKEFKVSTLVILRRILDLGGIQEDEFWDQYHKELSRLKHISTGQGGDFYRTQNVRLGKRFAKELVVSTLEGQTLYSDAFRLLGFSKLSTFEELGRRLGVG